jgi:hypothetical protein
LICKGGAGGQSEDFLAHFQKNPTPFIHPHPNGCDDLN